MVMKMLVYSCSNLRDNRKQHLSSYIYMQMFYIPTEYITKGDSKCAVYVKVIRLICVFMSQACNRNRISDTQSRIAL